MSELQHIVDRLRKYDHVDENVQQNINNAIVYLDLAISAEQSVQLTGGTLPDFQALFDPEVLSGLEADSTPLTANANR